MPSGDRSLRGVQAKLYVRVRFNLGCTPEIKVFANIVPRGLHLPIFKGDAYSDIAPVLKVEYIVMVMVTSKVITILLSQLDYPCLLFGSSLLADL